MVALHATEQLVTPPSAPLPVTEPGAAEVVSGPQAVQGRFDPGSWGLLLVPVLTGIGLCVAMLFVG